LLVTLKDQLGQAQVFEVDWCMLGLTDLRKQFKPIETALISQYLLGNGTSVDHRTRYDCNVKCLMWNTVRGFHQIEIEELDCESSVDSMIPKVCCYLSFAYWRRKFSASDCAISTTPECDRMKWSSSLSTL
jgi:hypothetical protein